MTATCGKPLRCVSVSVGADGTIDVVLSLPGDGTDLVLHTRDVATARAFVVGREYRLQVTDEDG